MNTVVKPYSPDFQHSIEELVLPIQQEEFEFEITREEQPDLIEIPRVFQTGVGNFWVALDSGKVIGTIGVIDIGNYQVALKKMFVAEAYRQKGVAQLLMDTATEWCASKGVEEIFLATNEKMLAAQQFYAKNGFAVINKLDLPSAFPIASVATKFYQKRIS